MSNTYGYEREQMAARAQAEEQQTAGRPGGEPYYYDSGYDSGTGSTAVAAWLLILGGLFSFFTGLAIVVKKAYFTSLPGYASVSHNYAFHWNLTAWGWGELILGILVVLAGVCVLLGQTWARWAGVVLAVISAVGSFVFLPIYPLWSIIVIAVDVFIIWALATARSRQDIPQSQ
jgi:hypothetical protein